MATKRKAKGKKAKGKTKAKRKKPQAAKVTARRKAAARVKKKPAKKKAQIRLSSLKKATPAPSVPTQAAPPGERIGVVTHYYSNLSVATLRLESGTLRVGDVIHIGGHTTDFSQRVESLEVNHAPATEVGPNDDFGLKVVGQVREHDVVYKLRP